jgi:hypothetical protein
MIDNLALMAIGICALLLVLGSLEVLVAFFERVSRDGADQQE